MMRAPLRAALLLLVLGCAGSQTRPSMIPVEASVDGRGWPFGESGLVPVMSIGETSRSRSYGWSEKNPIKLGGYDPVMGPASGQERQVWFLNSLWGPEGETVFYERIGTCCPFQHFGAPLDRAMLDVYSLTWEGLPEPGLLYMDRYRDGPVRVPAGLTTKIRNGEGRSEAG